MRSRLVTGIAVVTAVAAGGVGGALIGVPGLSGAQTVPERTRHDRSARAAQPGAPVPACAATRRCSTPRPRRSTSRPQQLRDKLSDGKTTIADVAKQQNVDINDGHRRDDDRRSRPHQQHRQQAVAAVRRLGPGPAAPGAPGGRCPASVRGRGSASASSDAGARRGGEGARHHDRRVEDRSRQGSDDRRHREEQEPRRQQRDRHARRRRVRRRSTRRSRTATSRRRRPTS